MMPIKHATVEADSRKYLPLGSPRFPLMSLCIVVRTLKKSASRRSMAKAEVTDSTAAGSDSSQERRIVNEVVPGEKRRGETVISFTAALALYFR